MFREEPGRTIHAMRTRLISRAAVTSLLAAGLLAGPVSAAHAAGGCSITSVGKASCGYRSDGVRDVYVIASTNWSITVNGKVLLSSAKGSAPAGAFKAAKGAQVRMNLNSPGTGTIA
jgi:hypothetical protein